MKNLHLKNLVTLLLGIGSCQSNMVCGATVFQNLNFEEATVPDLPSGSWNSSEPVADALPGWRAFIGTFEVTTVPHNAHPFGAVSVIIYGPYSWSSDILSGNYSAGLAGAYYYQPEFRNASIAQVGAVPMWANSIQFKVSPWAHAFTVSLGGNVLPTQQLSSTAQYLIWAADVSAYAGNETELRFTSMYDGLGPPNLISLDDIQFSTDMVPEPSALALGCTGGLVCWRAVRRKNKASIPHGTE
ncbi:MAG: hypothetical protein WCO56_03325 [Verrucomicrobiota bacterium]